MDGQMAGTLLGRRFKRGLISVVLEKKGGGFNVPPELCQQGTLFFLCDIQQQKLHHPAALTGPGVTSEVTGSLAERL